VLVTTEQAFKLCEIADYEAAMALVLWPPDLSASDPELLFLWGIITSQKGTAEQEPGSQERAKNLLTKAGRLLDGGREELCRVHLSLCYWRLGETREALALLDRPFQDMQAKFCAFLVRAIIFMEDRHLEDAMTALSECEFLADCISTVNRGKFHNQRARTFKRLAVRDGNLELIDRAIVEFEAALFYFEQSEAPKLQGAVINNLGRLYSQSGQHERAHEYIDRAIALAGNDKGLLAQWHDQKANAYLDEGKLELGKIASDKALALLVGGEQIGILADCAVTKARIEQQIYGTCAANRIMLTTPQVSLALSTQGSEMPATPLECAQRIIRDNHELAAPLLTLMALTVDPNGDPERYAAADMVMQFLFIHTPEGEEFYRSSVARIAEKPQEVGTVSS
jgi:tetratricopeptide (TPR) repeat protein